MSVNQMDTTSAALKERLEKLAKITKESYHAGETMKLAAISFVLDMLGIKDPKEREQAVNQWMATPGFFGCGNNSACRQHYERKTEEKTLKAYTGI